MKTWLLIIAQWCSASPYPFKNVPQCRQQLYDCVASDPRKAAQCFAVVEELPYPNWNKEKQR